MSKVTGFKFKISKDEIVPMAGEPVLPHRIDLIKEKMKNKQYQDCWKLFFNFDLDNCVTSLNDEQLEEEMKLYNSFILIADHPKNNEERLAA